MKKFVFILLLCAGYTSMQAQTRIVGGGNAGQTEFPWMVGQAITGIPSLSFAQECGGSLIAPNWVLTAAHCVAYDYSLPLDSTSTTSDVDYFLNAWVLSSPNTGYERIPAAEIIIHPSYNPANSDNDLALIRLSYNSAQSTLNLPAQGDNSITASGNNLTVMGWGVTNTSSSASADTLQKVQVQAVNTTICNGPGSYNGQITANMFCAGVTGGGKDACQGDSGGPIVAQVGSTWVQAGIVSWGYDCAQAAYPGVYTKVSNYTNWINNVMSGVGIEEPAFNQNVIITNQAQLLSIRFKVLPQEDVQLCLYNMMGQQVYSDQLRESADYTLADMAAGQYILNLKGKDLNISQAIQLF